MTDSWKVAAKVGSVVLAGAALAPLAYFGAHFVMRARCPECDAELQIVKEPGSWEPDLRPANEWD